MGRTNEDLASRFMSPSQTHDLHRAFCFVGSVKASLRTSFLLAQVVSVDLIYASAENFKLRVEAGLDVWQIEWKIKGMDDKKSDPFFWDSFDRTQRILVTGLIALVLAIFLAPVFVYKLKVHDCMAGMYKLVGDDSVNEQAVNNFKITCLKIVNGSF